jgi:RNA polymerase sigma-70 factor (ECF subfamily)
LFSINESCFAAKRFAAKSSVKTDSEAGGTADRERVVSLDAANTEDFKKIYDEAMQLLVKISVRIAGEDEAAEDIVHDSFIKMNEKKMVFPSMNDALFWLIRVVKNASLNYARRKKREQVVYQKALREDSRKVASGETEFLRKETREKTQEALGKLPENLRTVLVLREYADLKYKDIARILGITEGNVKIRVFRAREQLAVLLGEDNVYLPG